jgi:hypothetical protein
MGEDAVVLVRHRRLPGANGGAELQAFTGEGGPPFFLDADGRLRRLLEPRRYGTEMAAAEEHADGATKRLSESRSTFRRMLGIRESSVGRAP